MSFVNLIFDLIQNLELRVLDFFFFARVHMGIGAHWRGLKELDYENKKRTTAHACNTCIHRYALAQAAVFLVIISIICLPITAASPNRFWKNCAVSSNRMR